MFSRTAVLIASVVLVGGCASLLGIDDEGSGEARPDATSSGGDVGASTSSGGSSASGGASSSSGRPASSSSGTPVADAGNAWLTCSPGEESPCPLDPCGVGHFTCNAEGTGHGACTGTAAACTGAVGWSKRFGNTGTGGQSETAKAAAAGGGATYFVGTLKTDIDFDGEIVTAPLPASSKPTTGYLTKLAFDGSVVWKKAFSAAESMTLAGVTADPAGNVTVVGRSEGQTFDLGDAAQTGTCSFVARFAPDGSRSFVKTYCDAFSPIFTHVVAGQDGGLAIGGYALFGSDLGGGEFDTFGGSDLVILALGPDGTFRWSRGVGSSENDVMSGLGIDPTTGDSLVAISAAAAAVCFGAETDNAGVSAGTKQTAFVRLQRQDGVASWRARIDGVGGPFGRGLYPAPDGGFVWLYSGLGDTAQLPAGDQVTGKGFVVRFQPSGSIGWHRALTGNFVAMTAAVDLAGNVIVGGNRRAGDPTDLGEGPVAWAGGDVPFDGTNHDNVLLVAKYAAGGALRWARTLGDATDTEPTQFVSGITIEPGGEPTLFGQFVGSLVLPAATLVSNAGHGGTDVFVMRLAP